MLSAMSEGPRAGFRVGNHGAGTVSSHRQPRKRRTGLWVRAQSPHRAAGSRTCRRGWESGDAPGGDVARVVGGSRVVWRHQTKKKGSEPEPRTHLCANSSSVVLQDSDWGPNACEAVGGHSGMEAQATGELGNLAHSRKGFFGLSAEPCRLFLITIAIIAIVGDLLVDAFDGVVIPLRAPESGPMSSSFFFSPLPRPLDVLVGSESVALLEVTRKTLLRSVKPRLRCL
jgi:hypothetical protein